MPAYDYRCEQCGTEVEVWCVIADRHGQLCPQCGEGLVMVLKPRAMTGFEPRFDYGLGREVTGCGDVHQAMRAKALDYRDHVRPGDLSARLDRIEERKRAR